MSILDGKVFLDNENVNRNNGNNNSKKRNNNFRNNNNNEGKPNRNRRFTRTDLGFKHSSYLPDDYETDDNREDVSKEDNKKDWKAEKIIEFCEEFAENIDNYRTLQDIVIDGLPDIITSVKGYYGSKNTPVLQDALNKLIKLICTTQFSNTIKSVLESGVWTDNQIYSNIWDSIGFAISLALETNYTRMHSDTIKHYVTEIIPRMYKAEINDLVQQTGITPDLALDLYIAIPITDWNGANLEAFYSRFLDKMLIHADDNTDVLNWEIQGILFEKFFGKSKTALKVIGKYLTRKPVDNINGNVEKAVYEQFQKMIYSKLDMYDIGDIEYVMNFIVKKRQEKPDDEIIFNSSVASKYDNVRKGLLSVMDKNPDSMNYLA